MLRALFGEGYRRHLQLMRDHIYAEKMATHDVKKQQENGGRDVIFGPPAAIFGYFAGKLLRRGHRQSKELGWKRRIMRFYSILSYVFLAFTLFITLAFFAAAIGALIEVTFEGSSPAESLGAPILVVSLVLPAIPYFHARRLAKRDTETTKQLETLIHDPSVEQVDLAIQNITHHQERIRQTALEVTAASFEGSPGKAIKYSSIPPETVYSKLVSQLRSTDNATTAGYCLTALAWLSREYNRLPYQDANLFKQLVKSDHSEIQANAVLILGNLSLENKQEREMCATAIKPAVEDPDADVREAAAAALGNIRCDPSLKYLNHLTEDSAPDVRQTAVSNLETLG